MNSVYNLKKLNRGWQTLDITHKDEYCKQARNKIYSLGSHLDLFDEEEIGKEAKKLYQNWRGYKEFITS